MRGVVNHRPGTPGRTVVAGLLAGLALLAFNAAASAGFKYRVEPDAVSLDVGQAQQFTVYLDADSATPVGVVAYNVVLELRGDTAGVGFSAGARLPTPDPDGGTVPYIFAGSTGANFVANAINLDGTPAAFAAPGSLAISLSDVTEQTDADGNLIPTDLGGASSLTWKVGAFTVTNFGSPGGVVTVAFNRDQSNLLNLDPAGAPVTVPEVTFQDLKLSVNGDGAVTAVPAPGGAVLALIGCGCLLARRRRRRPAATP